MTRYYFIHEQRGNFCVPNVNSEQQKKIVTAQHIHKKQTTSTAYSRTNQWCGNIAIKYNNKKTHTHFKVGQMICFQYSTISSLNFRNKNTENWNTF